MRDIYELIRRCVTVRLSRFKTIGWRDTSIFDVRDDWYILGDLPANHLPPAIRQGYEFGWCLNTNEPTLIHWYQGRVDG